jgi:hypothetical protein
VKSCLTSQQNESSTCAGKGLFFGKTTRTVIRKYRPVLEYGGWGYRIFGNKRAFNISGDMGLQLEFTDKSKLLIGTSQPEALAEALKKAGKYKS